ncbi:unnamed protein product, partial [Mesorhabditis spiculigera]
MTTTRSHSLSLPRIDDITKKKPKRMERKKRRSDSVGPRRLMQSIDIEWIPKRWWSLCHGPLRRFLYREQLMQNTYICRHQAICYGIRQEAVRAVYHLSHLAIPLILHPLILLLLKTTGSISEFCPPKGASRWKLKKFYRQQPFPLHIPTWEIVMFVACGFVLLCISMLIAAPIPPNKHQGGKDCHCLRHPTPSTASLRAHLADHHAGYLDSISRDLQWLCRRMVTADPQGLLFGCSIFGAVCVYLKCLS